MIHIWMKERKIEERKRRWGEKDIIIEETKYDHSILSMNIEMPI